MNQLSLLNGTNTPVESSENEHQKDGSPTCKCGKGTLDCLIHPSTSESWTAFMRDSLVKICQSLESKVDWERELEAAYTVKSFALQALFDQDTSSWKMSQQSFLTDLDMSSQTWQKWGWTQDGAAYAHRLSGQSITVTDGGYLPTPSGTSNHGKNHVSGRLDEWGGSSNPWRGTEIGKVHCAAFEEWMLGLPFKWTELTESETPKSHCKQQLPIDCLGESK